jgi:hypothetical protein
MRIILLSMIFCTFAFKFRRSLYLMQNMTNTSNLLVSKSLPIVEYMFYNPLNFNQEIDFEYLQRESSTVSVFRKYRLFPLGKHSSFGCSAQAGAHFLLRNPVG